ncbi:MAG: nucleotidyl transferase AbiEii/AbiGii toxin family protein [Actinomycetota bacterium]|nr:nucleotidyl transferase AbiEii/AbiGii toxin family protein [Actinomycetota bacterium]
MTDLEQSQVAAVTELRSLGAAFALVGGLAVAVRAEPRLTRDADLAVSVHSDDEAEALVLQLVRRGYRTVAMVEQQATGRLATVRLTRAPRERDVVTDVLFASCGIEPEIVAAATDLEVVGGLMVPVASTGHLIAMKLLARDDRRRPADADDLRGLAEVAEEKDWTVAATAVALIDERGFARGRDLVDALARLRRDGAY